MTLKLVIAPDPILQKVSEPIQVIDDSIRELAHNMLITMYHAKGIGLSAVQVGILKRLIVVDVGDNKKYVLINPEIIESSDEIGSYKEGCLSFPGQFADIYRPKVIKVRYKTLDNSEMEESFDGLLATCIQHEIDHLNGVVFVDHLSELKRDILMRKLNKLKRRLI